MKLFIKRLLLTLLLLPILLAVIFYFAIQTSTVAGKLSQWLSQHFPYAMTVGSISHSLWDPYQIVLNQVSIEDEKGKKLLLAKRIVLDTSQQQFEGSLHFQQIIIKDALLDLLALTDYQLPVSSNSLRLENVKLNFNNQNLSLRAEQINGGVTPWFPANDGEKESQFRFTVAELYLNDIEAKRVLLQGKQGNHQLTFTQIGADFHQGQLSGRATRSTAGDWSIDKMYLSDIKWQTKKTLSQLVGESLDWPTLAIHHFDLVNANIEGYGWALNDFNLSLDNTRLEQGKWYFDDSSFVFNALDVVLGDLHFEEPILKLGLNNDLLTIRQLSSRWQKGLLRAKGKWFGKTKQLTLSELAIAGLEYRLPSQWLGVINQPIARWFNTFTIERLMLNRNLVVDISVDFPFQLTLLDGYAHNLTIVKEGKLGLWATELKLNAHSATVNKINLRYPSLSLTADSNQIKIPELNALTDGGFLEAAITVEQQLGYPYSLQLEGKNVPLDLLNQWGWSSPLPASTNGDLQLEQIYDGEQTTSRLLITDDQGEKWIEQRPGFK